MVTEGVPAGEPKEVWRAIGKPSKKTFIITEGGLEGFEALGERASGSFSA